MFSSIFFYFLFIFYYYFYKIAFGACVSPPSDLNVCPLPAGASIPQEYANTNADRELQSYFNFLEGIKATPTKKCAEAYIAFACSRAYPKCVGDANSGLGLAENTCYYLCSDFTEECRGQLVGVERPNCGQFSVSEDCTGRKLKIASSGASSLSAGFMLAAFAALVALL